MKIMIMGAGAVGGFVGSRLQISGQDVHYIARGEHLRAMREHGLRVTGSPGETLLRVKASDDPGDFGEMDLIIITVKSQDTHDALELIRPCVSDRTLILTLQNGIENEGHISSVFGPERTLGGVAYIGVWVDTPGVIVNQTDGRIAMGPLDPGALPQGRYLPVVDAIRTSGIHLTVTHDIMRRKWGKLTWNATFNPVSVLTGRSSFVLKGDVMLRPFLEGIVLEVVTVAAREGVRLDHAGILERMFDLSLAVPGTKTSMLQDYEKGKPLELDALNGFVVRKGEEHHVPTPLNRLILALTTAKVRQRNGWGRTGDNGGELG